jgi:hypothetical protein
MSRCTLYRLLWTPSHGAFCARNSPEASVEFADRRAFRGHLSLTKGNGRSNRKRGVCIVSDSVGRLDHASGSLSGSFCFWCLQVLFCTDRTTQLQYLISGNNGFGRVNLGRDTATAALKKAKELLQEGYMDVRISTPRGQVLLSDEFDQLETS